MVGLNNEGMKLVCEEANTSNSSCFTLVSPPCGKTEELHLFPEETCREYEFPNLFCSNKLLFTYLLPKASCTGVYFILLHVCFNNKRAVQQRAVVVNTAKLLIKLMQFFFFHLSMMGRPTTTSVNDRLC